MYIVLLFNRGSNAFVRIIQDYTGCPFQLIWRETKSTPMFFGINLLLCLRFTSKYSCTNKKVYIQL